MGNWQRIYTRIYTPAPEAQQMLRLPALKNIGRGSASHIRIHLPSHKEGDRPTAAMGTARFAILAAGESLPPDSEIVLHWKNVPAMNDLKHLDIRLMLSCRDTRNNYHETRYQLFAMEPAPPGVQDQIAPGVSYGVRTVIARSGKWLAFRVMLERLPLVGRFFRRYEYA